MIRIPEGHDDRQFNELATEYAGTDQVDGKQLTSFHFLHILNELNPGWENNMY